MTLTLLTTIAAGGAIKEAATSPDGLHIACIVGTNLLIYTLSTGALVTTTGITNGDALSWLNSTTIGVTNGTDTSVRIISNVLTAPSVITVTGIDRCPFNSKSQQLATSSPGASSGAGGAYWALGLAYTAGQFILINGGVSSAVTVPANFISVTGEYPTCIASSYSNGGTPIWIVGFNSGVIAEIEVENLAAYPSITLQVNCSYKIGDLVYLNSGTAPINASPYIYSLHYDPHGWLVASTTNGNIYLINHQTQTILQSYPISRDYSTGPTLSPEAYTYFNATASDINYPVISTPAGGVSPDRPVTQWDIFRTPMNQDDVVITTATTDPIASGIAMSGSPLGSTTYAWTAAGSSIFVYTVTNVRALNWSLGPTLPQTSTPTELILIDDSNGVPGQTSLIFHTDLLNQKAPIPKSLAGGVATNNIIAMISYNSGTSQVYAVNRVTAQ